MEHAVANTKQTGLPTKATPNRGPATTAESALHPALQLQQQVGNQAMQQLLRSGIIQAKLAISQPDDPEEREADATANRIMRSHAGASAAATPCSCGTDEETMCDECRQKAAGISRKATAPGPASSSHHLFDTMKRSAGHPLDASTRSFFEPHFGRDFSDVRIHTDASAAASARSIQAHAFTAGSEIFFAAGKYSPRTEEGGLLLAHELTHVVQQPSGAESPFLAGLPTFGRAQVLRQADAGVADPPPAPTNEQAPPAQTKEQTPTDADAGAPPADAGTPSSGTYAMVTLPDGTVLTDNEKDLEREVKGRIYQDGFDGGQRLLDHLNTYISVNRPEAGVEGLEALEGPTKVRDVLQTVVTRVNGENETFLDKFESDAKAVLEATLKDSENRIKTELLRYGITEIPSTSGAGEGADAEEEHDESPTYSMNTEGPDVKGLSAAANILLTRREDISKLQSVEASHMHSRCFKGDCYDYPDDGYAKAHADTEESMRGYKILFEKLKAEFPTLASFGDLSQGTDGLAQLANGPSPQAAELIFKEAKEKLDNIQETRDGLGTPDGSIWKLPRILSLTKAARGIETDTYEEKLIDHKIDDLSSSWRDIALGVIGLAFALLAPVTGGLSLVVTAAISTGIAVEHLQQYELQSAMAGTDFDKARAISDDPSLFWLALDIVGAVLDVAGGAGAVLDVVKTAARVGEARALVEALTPAVRTAEAAKTEEEFTKAAQAIRDAGKEAEAPAELTEKVIANLERQRALGSGEAAFGATEKEVDALKAAARSGDELMTPERLLGDSEELAEEGTHITKTGELWTCSSPCTQFRSRYAAALAQEETLLPELEDVEKLAKEAADNPGNKELGREAKRRARVLESKLRGVATPARIAELDKLTGLRTVSPAVADFTPEAFERILSSRKNLDHATGQLLEELLNSRQATREAREAAAGTKAVKAAGKAGSEIEFIPGYLLRDSKNRLITDGILGYREGGKFRIVKIFESKAGEDAAQKLATEAGRLSKAGWSELGQVAAENVRADLKGAGGLSKANLAKLDGMSAADIRKAYPAEFRKASGKLIQSEAGQARRTLERLAPNADEDATTLFRTDSNEPLQVTAGPVSSQVVGLVPGDVDPKDLIKGIQGQGINVNVLKADLTKDELRNLAQSIIDAAGKSGV
jgi:hypothetical protein